MARAVPDGTSRQAEVVQGFLMQADGSTCVVERRIVGVDDDGVVDVGQVVQGDCRPNAAVDLDATGGRHSARPRLRKETDDNASELSTRRVRPRHGCGVPVRGDPQPRRGCGSHIVNGYERCRRRLRRGAHRVVGAHRERVRRPVGQARDVQARRRRGELPCARLHVTTNSWPDNGAPGSLSSHDNVAAASATRAANPEGVPRR